jgi:hypothetical protein
MQETNKGMYKMIGFEIDNPPENWKTFVERVQKNTDPFFAGMPENAFAA